VYKSHDQHQTSLVTFYSSILIVSNKQKPNRMQQPKLIVLLLASFIGAAQSQTWAGTYTAGSSCSTSVCCCLSGQVVLTSSSTNVYTVTSGVSGVCGSASTFSGTAYTSGYTGWMLVVGNNDTLTLSSNSQTITVTNPVSSACSGTGTKSGAIKQHANIIMLFAIALIGMVMSVSKNIN
jgi:hypothetical protein